MQQITTGCLHSHTLVERLTVLQEMDLRAHFRLRQRFVFNQARFRASQIVAHHTANRLKEFWRLQASK